MYDSRAATLVLECMQPLRKNSHRGPKPGSTIVLPARPLLTRRRHCRNRRRVRRTSSGRSVYNYFRDYDAVTGRYIQSDPIGLRGGTNTYGYTGSNPLVRIDPFGQKWVPCKDVSVGAMCWVPDPVVDRVPTCATAECAAGIPPNRPLRVDQDDFADFFRELSRQSKAAAAACSVSPTPQGAGGLIVFGALGLAADAAEQLLRPDVSKSVTQLAVEVGTIGLPPQVGAPAQLIISEYVRLNPEGAQRNETN
jgi:RHS repeat-associated protein